jgi:periplasmic divalent cation tolerance protein
MEPQCLVVLVTAPAQQAEPLARALVDEALAACVNLTPAVRSIYRWEGRVEQAQEVLLVIKTRAQAFEALRLRVLSLHPYQCPEIIALPVVAGHPAYLEWLAGSVQLTS